MKKLFFALIAMFFGGVAYGAVNTAVCAACHGAHFEKHAMGRSRIVANMTNKQVIKALLGYKSGTRNKHGMGMIMHAQVAKYTVSELKAVKIGKKSVKTTSTKKKKSTKKVKVISNKKEIYIYKQENTCWSVDYKNKKSSLVACPTESLAFPPSIPRIKGLEAGAYPPHPIKHWCFKYPVFRVLFLFKSIDLQKINYKTLNMYIFRKYLRKNSYYK